MNFKKEHNQKMIAFHKKQIEREEDRIMRYQKMIEDSKVRIENMKRDMKRFYDD
jgi:hypothetical protein